jgi:hypothetical protein
MDTAFFEVEEVKCMGTSTRKTLPRSNRIINETISNGIISSTNGGNGLANLIPKFVFPDKGQSKIKKASNNIFNSGVYYSSVKKIVKTIKTINLSGLSGLGISGITSYNKVQQIEILADYLGIENEETLKQSFKDTLLEVDIFAENVNPVAFIIKYIQNILKNVIESYTFEDASQQIENFNDKITDEEFSNYIERNTNNSLSLCLDANFVENIDDEELTIKNLNKAYNTAMQALKG